MHEHSEDTIRQTVPDQIRILRGMALPGTLPAAQPQPPAPPGRQRSNGVNLLKGLVGAGLAIVLVLVLVAGYFGPGQRFFGGNSYAFLAMNGDEPIAWNHCQAIRYQVNPKGAPVGWEDIVDRAVQDIEDASGYVFRDLGTSAKTQLIGQRYDGNEWEPVLIAWSDRYQTGLLDGSVIGRGGSRATYVGDRERYVIGQVWLDSTMRDPFATQMVLEHELGHVLGLDHTGNSQQLMYEAYHGQKGLGKGDIAGLKKLHDVPCP